MYIEKNEDINLDYVINVDDYNGNSTSVLEFFYLYKRYNVLIKNYYYDYSMLDVLEFIIKEISGKQDSNRRLVFTTMNKIPKDKEYRYIPEIVAYGVGFNRTYYVEHKVKNLCNNSFEYMDDPESDESTNMDYAFVENNNTAKHFIDTYNSEEYKLLTKLNKIGKEIDDKKYELDRYLVDNYVRIYNPGDIVKCSWGGLYLIEDKVSLRVNKTFNKKIKSKDISIWYDSFNILKSGKIGSKYNSISPAYAESYKVVGNIKDYPTPKDLKKLYELF